MSEEKPQLSKQLREFQALIKPIQKQGTNPFFSTATKKSKYAKHEDVFEYFLPILSKCGLSIHQSGKDHNDTFYLYTVLENDFGEKRESSWPVCKSDKDAQKKCADTTLISRHAAMRILGLSATDDDTDGDVPEHKERTPIKPVEKPIEKKPVNHAPVSIDDRLNELFKEKKLNEHEVITACSRIAGREVLSINELTSEEKKQLGSYIKAFK